MLQLRQSLYRVRRSVRTRMRSTASRTFRRFN